MDSSFSFPLSSMINSFSVPFWSISAYSVKAFYPDFSLFDVSVVSW